MARSKHGAWQSRTMIDPPRLRARRTRSGHIEVAEVGLVSVIISTPEPLRSSPDSRVVRKMAAAFDDHPDSRRQWSAALPLADASGLYASFFRAGVIRRAPPLELLRKRPPDGATHFLPIREMWMAPTCPPPGPSRSGSPIGPDRRTHELDGRPARPLGVLAGACRAGRRRRCTAWWPAASVTKLIRSYTSKTSWNGCRRIPRRRSASSRPTLGWRRILARRRAAS